MAEQWRDIAGYDGVYQVSDLGQIRNTQTNKILQPIKLKNGRFYVSLSSDGFQKKCMVHSLVATAFLGDYPPNREITPKDGDYTNNQVSNLEYITRQESQKRFVMRTGGYSLIEYKARGLLFWQKQYGVRGGSRNIVASVGRRRLVMWTLVKSLMPCASIVPGPRAC